MIASALAGIFSRGNYGVVRPDDPNRYLRYLPVPQLPVNLQFTMDTALQLSVVWACVDAIAKAISSSYWHVYKFTNGRREYLPDDPLDWLLNTQPNPEMSAIGFREAILYSALTWGNGYAEIVKDRAGRVAQLWPLLPERMTPRRTMDESAQLYYEYHSLNGPTYELPAKSVLHVRGPSLTGLMGENIVARAAKAIALAMASERYALSYYGNDTVVGGMLEYPGKLTPETHNRLKEEWQEYRQGPDKSHRPMILEGGMKFTNSNTDATKTQMIESRRFQVEEICRWFGVPPHKVQHLDRATFNNIEHLGLEFVRDALTPWAKRLEQEVDAKLFSARALPMRKTRVDMAWLSQGDNQSRSTAALTWRQAGVKTANEIRHEEGLNPLDDEHGDVLLVGSGMQTMDNLLHPPQPAAPGVPGEEPETDEAEEKDGEEVNSPDEPPHNDVVRESVVCLFASAMERYTRRLNNRVVDLQRHELPAARIAENIAEERERLRPWMLRECENGLSIVRRVYGDVDAQTVGTVVSLAADQIDNGAPPQIAAERLVGNLLTAAKRETI